jgi:hypothetical protein
MAAKLNEVASNRSVAHRGVSLNDLKLFDIDVVA